MKLENSARAAEIIYKVNVLSMTIDRLTFENIQVIILDPFGITIICDYPNVATRIESEPYRKLIMELVEGHEKEIQKLSFELQTLWGIVI